MIGHILRAVGLLAIVAFEIFAIWFIVHYDYLPRLVEIGLIAAGGWTGIGALLSLITDSIPEILEDIRD